MYWSEGVGGLVVRGSEGKYWIDCEEDSLWEYLNCEPLAM